MAWLSVILASGCLAIALLHGLRTLSRWRAGELPHAVMALGMAAMFAPPFDPVPRLVWVATFALCAVWTLAAVLVRRGGFGTEPGHHLVGSVAMLFMLLGGHQAAGWRAPVAILLAGACTWHALRCVERLAATSPERGPTDLRAAVATAPTGTRVARLVDTGHVVVAVAMSTMLLGAL